MLKRYDELTSARDRSWGGWHDNWIPERLREDGTWHPGFDSKTIDPTTGKPFVSTFSGSGEGGFERAKEKALELWPDSKVRVRLVPAAEFYQPMKRREGTVVWEN